MYLQLAGVFGVRMRGVVVVRHKAPLDRRQDIDNTVYNGMDLLGNKRQSLDI